MTAVVLHLSDIHIRSAKDPILSKGKLIAQCTFGELADASIVFVVVSGDVAYSGKKEEYEAAKPLFHDIKNSIQTQKNSPVHFVFVPGNHDCDFSIGGKPRTLTLNAVREDPTQLDDDVIVLGTSTQIEFRKFSEEFETEGETRAGDSLWKSHRFTVEGNQIVFDGINVAWCSNIKEEPGSLIFPIERYTKLQNETVDLRVTVLNQPINWLNQSSYHTFRRFIRQLSNIIISGHEHIGGAGEDIHTASGHSAYVEGCVLQGEHDLSDSSFNVVVFNLDDGTYKSSKYLWSSENYYTLNQDGTWSDYRDLPQKNQIILPLKKNSSYY